MTLKEMLKLLEFYVDDVVQPDTAVPLLNAGQNKMAIEVKANFPQLILTPDLSGTFVFPDKYQEVPILYAAAMVKAADSSLREKESFLFQFNEALRNFTENYDPDPQYREASNTQQFVVSDAAGQTEFIITKETYSHTYGNPTIYVDGYPVGHQPVYPNKLRLSEPAPLNSLVTVIWDENFGLMNQPAYYPGW